MFCFIGLLFLKKDKKEPPVYLCFFPQNSCLKKTSNNTILMLKANQLFLKSFYDNKIKIVLILTAGREFFRAKCVQFLLAFKE